MDREQLIKECEKDFKRVNALGRHYKYADSADLLLRHTSELQKENEEMKKQLSLCNVDQFNAEAEVVRLKELVAQVEKMLDKAVYTLDAL